VAGTADFASTATAFGRAARATGDERFAIMEASYWSSAGDTDRAEQLFSTMPEARMPVALARHWLKTREPERVDRLLAPLVEGPERSNITAWGVLGLAWQWLGDDRAYWLHGQPGLIQTIDLGLSEAEIAAAVSRLRTLHTAQAHPIGQSIRGGTQTRGDLFHRLEPEIRCIRDTIRNAIESYRAALPPADPRHPLLSHRDAPLPFGGSWSVRLTAGGHHVAHIHPTGVLSSASYWVLPPASPDDPRSGWLELGGAPIDLLDIPLEPIARIEPRIGMLALFPSTLHHGTRPFPAGERLTVAFDVLPGQPSNR
jgi:hypothetical protein